jgi:radical SAM-linked protein
MRLFKRSFKRLGIKLSHSQGFNPHPKMSFAQPLSLGYESSGEILEFETIFKINEENILELLNLSMPEGIKIFDFKEIKPEGKSLAATAEFAEYTIKLPCECGVGKNIDAFEFLNQEEIISQKLNKNKEIIQLDIKKMIKELVIRRSLSGLEIFAKLDAGSISNLSPELLIKAIGSYYNINYDRSDVEVTRETIYFTNNLQF